MFRELKIGAVNVPMLANAATPYRLKQVFNVDITKAFFNAKKDGGVEMTNIIPQLAYVMNCQATNEDMKKLNEDTFFKWCEQFGAFDLTSAGEDIVNLYLENQNGESVSKKK